MRIKKILLNLVTILLFIVSINMFSIKSEAYYELDDNLEYYSIPKGGEFIYNEFIYRVTKPVKSDKKTYARGEVEVIGFNPEWDWGTSYSKKYISCAGFSDLEEEYDFLVVGIADNAFKGDKTIRSFSTGNYNKYIGKSAFEGCTQMKDFYADRHSLTKIESKAFYGCTSLKIFYVYQRVKSIDKNAFKNTKSKMKVVAYNFSSSNASKLKKKMKKSGAKKTIFKFKKTNVKRKDICL